MFHGICNTLQCSGAQISIVGLVFVVFAVAVASLAGGVGRGVGFDFLVCWYAGMLV